jgi:uncharacterized protein (DUF3820 family)
MNLADRLSNPIKTEQEALRQLKQNGQTLTEFGENKLKQYDKMKAQVKPTVELLEEILSWMTENDYECGPIGSVIHFDIRKEIERLKEL